LRASTCAGDAAVSDGEARSDGKGGRCVCAGGTWFCNDTCHPTPPAAGTACDPGSACTYPAEGVTCACVGPTWVCLSHDACPSRVPTTGSACDGMTGLACDYPGSMHLGCACLSEGRGPRWTCLALAGCPVAKPEYRATCDAGPALCIFGSSRCGCLRPGGRWFCV
jgi:hypothetical protein